MNFYLIGINYKTVPDQVRELAYRQRHCIKDFCREELKGQASVLFTCNRVEIYGFTRGTFIDVDVFLKIKEVFPEIFSHGYFKSNTHEALCHFLRLACGLDSQIRGEGQIVEQLRSWIAKDIVSCELRNKLESVLEWAIDIRALSNIDDFKKDIVDFTLEDCRDHLDDLKGKSVLVIGTGKVAELISCKDLSGSIIYFAARKKHAKARKLAFDVGGELISFDDLPKIIAEVDVVISATSSPHPIITGGKLTQWIQARSKDLYMYDLAMPKDIEIDDENISGVKLYDADDLTVLLDAYHNDLNPIISKMESLVKKIVWMVSDETSDQSWSKAEFVGV
jgi:glutamyl-tRNA reductase